VIVLPLNKEDKDTNYCVMQLSAKCKNKEGILPFGDFYSASNINIFKNGKMPICKHCFKEYIYVDGEISIDKLKNLLMICDYPFYSVEFKSALEDKKETLGTYFKNIQLNHKGATWSSGDIINNSNIVINESGEVVEFDFKATPEMIKFWSKGYTNEEYQFLQEYYHDLIRIYDHSQPVQINNYRNMAKTQLQANKCLATGDMGGYDKAMKILSMLNGDSNIKPVQESSSDRVQKGGFDTFVKHLEDDEPIFDWEKDLGHIDVIKNLLNIFFFGHLSKVLNIPNPFADEYDEEMKSYTVGLDEVEEEKNQVDFLGDSNGE
jgi:hypothetical protein